MTTTTHPVDSKTCLRCGAIGGHADDCIRRLRIEPAELWLARDGRNVVLVGSNGGPHWQGGQA
jgi:hypothetical protein